MGFDKTFPILPMKTITVPYLDLSPLYQEAVKICTDCFDLHEICVTESRCVEIVTVSAIDVKRLLLQWGLHSSLDQPTKIRVKKIMDLIQTEGQYPYVSYIASSLQELATVEVDYDGEWIIHNHGDGFHRMIATLGLRLQSLDFLFFV